MKTFIAGNWKMNQTRTEIKNFFNILSSEKIATLPNAEAWIAPQFIHIDYVKSLITSNSSSGCCACSCSAKEETLSSSIKVGAQNCSSKEKGALTGDVSAKAIADSGCHFVIIGHSERRSIFKEDPILLKEKVQQALSNKLKVIFCIGETLAERERGDAFSVVAAQLRESLQGTESSYFGQEILLAYEPVWAIGTGKTATPAEAQEMHSFIRRNLAEELKISTAKETPILYGGSVTPQNIEELLRQPDINGALVGGASLKGVDFSKLYLAAKVKIG